MSVKQRRLQMAWSQEELAQHAGLSTRTIQRIEAGHKAGLESLKCLAAVFETSISTLQEEQVMLQAKPKAQKATTESSDSPLLLEIEREAIEFAQSLLKGSSKDGSSSLSKLESDAVQYAKNLLKKFGE